MKYIKLFEGFANKSTILSILDNIIEIVDAEIGGSNEHPSGFLILMNWMK